LRGRQLGGHKFTDQFPIGGKVADFACRSAKLVVELHRGQHDLAAEEDAERTRQIAAFGYRVGCPALEIGFSPPNPLTLTFSPLGRGILEA
jgi:hypothetical protein